MNIESETLRVLANLQRIRRTVGCKTFAVVFAPGRGYLPPRFSAMPRHEMERLKYMETEPWRLVGVYRSDVSANYIADDLAAWCAEQSVAITQFVPE